jgi:serine/threonine protein kinase
VKPENIMFSKDGHVLLADFGLAMRFDSGSSLDPESTTLVRSPPVGTQMYMAPEVAAGQPYNSKVRRSNPRHSGPKVNN